MIEATEADDRLWRWGVRVLYVTLISAELWVLWDWWRETPSGQETVARWRYKWADVKRRAEECEGCAKRREWLQRQTNRMHWQAMEIVEQADEEQAG